MFFKKSAPDPALLKRSFEGRIERFAPFYINEYHSDSAFTLEGQPFLFCLFLSNGTGSMHPPEDALFAASALTQKGDRVRFVAVWDEKGYWRTDRIENLDLPKFELPA